MTSPPSARITVSRQSPEDVGEREIFVSIDGTELAILRTGESAARDVAPGAHELRAHNTLFRKRQALTLAPGEHARFVVVNRIGWGSYTMMTLLGAGPLYLSLERLPNEIAGTDARPDGRAVRASSD